MIIRAYWPDCRMLNGTWGERSIAAFFVECATRQEVEEKVLPHVPLDQLERLQRWIQRDELYNRGTYRPWPERGIAYLLIARDLSSFSAHR